MAFGAFVAMNSTSLLPVIQLAMARLPQALAPDTLYDLYSLASTLPDCGHVFLECRLGDGEKRVDLSLADYRSDSPLFRYVRSPELAAVIAGEFGRAINGLYLEYDVPPEKGLPSIFVGLGLSRPPPRSLALRLARAGLESVSEHDLKTIDRYFNAIGPGMEIMYFGLMLGRNAPSFRLNVSSPSAAALLDFTESAGMPKAQQQGVSRMLDLANCPDVEFLLAIDILGGDPSRVGLECFGQWDGPAQWAPVLQRLNDERICSVAESEALMLWHSEMPGMKLLDSFLRSPRYRFRLNHIKLICESDRTFRAKAYLIVRRLLCTAVQISHEPSVSVLI